MADNTRKELMSIPTFVDPGITNLLKNIFKDDDYCNGDVARAYVEIGITNYDIFINYEPKYVDHFKHKNNYGNLQDV